MRPLLLLPLTAALAAAVPASTPTSCDIYCEVLDVFSAQASPFCSKYKSAPLPTPLPTWLSAIGSVVASKVSTACDHLLTSSATRASISATLSRTIASSSATTAAASMASSAPSTTFLTSSIDSSAPASSSTSSALPTFSSSSTSSAPSTVRTSAPDGSVVVSQGGESGTYATVQEGVNALSTTETGEQSLFIYPGVYVEQVYIPARAANLTIYGYTLDTSSYEGNTVNITYNLALANTTSDDLTATVRNWSKNSKMYNINILNTFGHISKNGQNLALSAHTTNQGYYGVGLYGYQDTLLANTGTQLYARSLILGAIDFIFGQTAQAWLDSITILTIAKGCITASGRADATNPSWYVINNSTVSGVNASVEAMAGINYLGRPWESFARVTFQNTYLSDVINPAGWSVWSTTTPNTGNVTFEEFANYGPGSATEEGPRANFSSQISEPRRIEEILGTGWEGEWWVDSTYVSSQHS